jgi:hypothetical protein
MNDGKQTVQYRSLDSGLVGYHRFRRTHKITILIFTTVQTSDLEYVTSYIDTFPWKRHNTQFRIRQLIYLLNHIYRVDHFLFDQEATAARVAWPCLAESMQQ